MKKIIIWCLLGVAGYSNVINAQSNGKPSQTSTNLSEVVVDEKKSFDFSSSFVLPSKDSLVGYDEKKIISNLKSINVYEPEYSNYLDYSKRIFVNTKYNLGGYKPSPNMPLSDSLTSPSTPKGPGKGYSSASINAPACVNEDFEATGPGFYGNSIAGWTIDWTNINSSFPSNCQTGTGWLTGASKFQIRTTPVSNPWPEISSTFVPALSSIPPSPLGGTKIAQLGDFVMGPPPGGSSAIRTRIRKTFTVSNANKFFQFAFMGAWEVANHVCCANPSILVNLYDCSGNLLPCGSFDFESGPGCVNSGLSFSMCNLWCYSWKPFNYGKIAYNAKWEVRYINLSQLVGKCITVEFINSSCAAGAHTGSVFLDCQCNSTTPGIGTQLVGGGSQMVVSPVTQTVCPGQSAVVNVTGVSSVNWYKKNTFGLYQFWGTGTSSVFPTMTSGTHNFSVSGTAGVCSSPSSATFQIFVHNPAALGIAITPNPVCAGQSAKLSAAGSSPGFSFYWPHNGSTASSVMVTPSVTTPYTLQGVSSVSGCSGTVTYTVNVAAQPTLTAVSNPVARCSPGFFTLTASGYSTSSAYVWMPGASIGNSYWVSGSTTQIYTVSASSASNCAGTATVAAIVLTTPTVTAAPAAVCAGLTNTLTGSGAVNYTFYIGGSSPSTVVGQSVTITPTSATPYTLCGSVPGATTCSSCITGIIPMGTVIPMSVPPSVTLCTNGGPCISLTATSTVPSANFNWQPGNQNGSTVSVCPTANAQYVVSATSTVIGNCPNSSTVSVTYTNANCCPNPPASLVPLTNITGNLSNTSYFLNSSQVLTGNANFVNSEVWITPGIQITVPTGSVLNLENTHLFACGNNMWQGIKVVDGGRITTSNTRFTNSMIEDAEIGIELNGINSANVVAGTPAIDISRVIFNKNFIGIKISNSNSSLDSLALGINGCVFASRDMTFTSAPAPLIWPTASNLSGSGGLREATSTTVSLISPYTMNSFNQVFLKFPHNGQSAHIGIKVENIGNPFGFSPVPGVQFGITYRGAITNDFNLFDGLGNGIDIKNSSLTTANNIFQNSQRYIYSSVMFGGAGIYQEITDIRNARLKLTSYGTTSNGNQFWNCHKGVEAQNVFDLGIKNSIFRSTHDKNSGTPLLVLGFTQGDVGIDCSTNRFNFNVIESEFNNIRHGIDFRTPALLQSYDMTGGSSQLGTFAQSFTVFKNYFGAQVSSGVAISTEYLSDGIIVTTPNITGWQNNAVASYVTSNKFDRVYRGIYLNNMNDHPLFIGGNKMLINDDYVYGLPDFGWGVKVENNNGSLAIVNNTLQGQGVASNSVSLILCNNNSGITSPSVSCNVVSDSKFGFEFSGFNQSTFWSENYMCNHFGGLALTNGGVIGQQGGSTWGGNANSWNTSCTWSASTNNYQTYCLSSNPVGSELYVFSPSAAYEPTVHGFSGGSPYANGPSVIPTSTNNITDCIVFNPYPSPPSWRSSSITNIEETENDKLNYVEVYPNPTRGTVVVNVPGLNGDLQIKVRDITGKSVIEKLFENTKKAEIDLSDLPSGVYFIGIKSTDTKVIYKKIIKLD